MKCPKCKRELGVIKITPIFIENRISFYERFPYERYLYEGECSSCKKTWSWTREYSFGTMKERDLEERK